MTTITFQHSIHAAHHHWSWDRNLEPVLRVDPGATVRIELNDPGGGQIHAASMAGDLLHLDFSRVNPVTGPLFVNGAESGDTISLEIVDIEPCGWGWSALIPGFGLLADEFREPYLVHWNYDKSGSMPAVLHDAGRVPLNPMVGAIGLAPAAPGPHDILPPRRVGGTMDIRDITRGAVVHLPVDAPGGLLSCGDGHAAQGDGEVCGTGLESAMSVTIRVDLLKNTAPAGPRLSLPGPVTRHLDGSGYDVTTGIGPDLMSGARDAVRNMIDLLCVREKMSPENAYILCSLAADLRISEIVDKPNWIVSLYFPRAVLE